MSQSFKSFITCFKGFQGFQQVNDGQRRALGDLRVLQERLKKLQRGLSRILSDSKEFQAIIQKLQLIIDSFQGISGGGL